VEKRRGGDCARQNVFFSAIPPPLALTSICLPSFPCVPMQTEMLRGARQYGADVALSELPCSALGARVDLKALAGEAGFLMPTNTFSGKTTFTVRGVGCGVCQCSQVYRRLFVCLKWIGLLREAVSDVLVVVWGGGGVAYRRLYV
jgi:hypothetical protein